ncbi:MAG: hypothetical protein NWP64_09915, partial [Maribacter sp.]|nr:hypothetical protein [Maribacter sp.]
EWTILDSRRNGYNGGNNIGNNKDDYLAGDYPTNYGRNYQHMLWMEHTSGNVHLFRDLNNPVNEWDWDDKVVGHFFPPMSTTAWDGGNTAALLQEDFNLWNEKAIQNGGSISWGVSLERANLNNGNGGILTAKDWAYDQIVGADAHICALPNTETNGAPKWFREYTVLPEATAGQAYYHVLVEGIDFWDPEGDDIIKVFFNNAPSWLVITEDTSNPRNWILSGTPTETAETEYAFSIEATEVNNLSQDRNVELLVNPNNSLLVDPGNGEPIWISDPISITIDKLVPFTYDLNRGINFEDFDGDALTIIVVGGDSSIVLQQLAPNVWQLSGNKECVGSYSVDLSLTDGVTTANTSVEIEVVNPNYLEMITNSIDGGAHWSTIAPFTTPGLLTYNNDGTNNSFRSVLYSEEEFQSTAGFTLTVNFSIADIDDNLGNNFSFGLISTDTDFENYIGYNPFGSDTSVYSLGVNVTSQLGVDKQGVNFTDGSSVVNVDQSGTFVQFSENTPVEVVLQVLSDNTWSYYIDGTLEASGTLNFDFTKSYKVAFYGRDDNGGPK